MIIRVSIANLDLAEAAKLGQKGGFAGTVYANVGFGSWGVEHGVTFEFATLERGALRVWVRDLLTGRNEQAAYVTVNGERAELWWADGRTEDIAA